MRAKRFITNSACHVLLAILSFIWVLPIFYVILTSFRAETGTLKLVALIKYNKAFDDDFRYDKKDLGTVCSKEGAIFKVWCPLATKVELKLYADGQSENGEFPTCVAYMKELGITHAHLLPMYDFG